MEFPELHRWEITAHQAVALQRELAGRVILEDRLPRPLTTVAGVDVSYAKHGDLFFAAVVVLSLPALEMVESVSARARSPFPYIPGLLSFRELPVLLQAFRQLQTVPEVILVDGQGIAHPRRLGLACHLGLWLGLPTIGCAKSLLCGDYDPPGSKRGEQTPLHLHGERIGTVLATRDGVRPLFISPGHQVDHAAAVRTVLACGCRYRLPEPTRQAHLFSNRARMKDEG